MKALCWMGRQKVEIQDVPEPQILNRRDAIVRVTSTAICGSDLHLYNGFIPTMKKGDILGHEFMGEIVEVGPGVRNLHVGDRVVVPFTVACGECWHCRHDMWSLCENSNPNAALAEKTMGHAASGTSFPRDGWAPRCATSTPVTWWLCGGADPSASSRSGARISSEPSA